MELLASEATLLFSLLAGFSSAAGFQKGLGLSEDSLLGKKNLAPWTSDLLRSPPGIPEAIAPPDARFPLILAARRTRRPDILHGFELYRGGWDITNRHYWTSTGFTGAAGIILAFVWFIFFGVALLANSCCQWRINMKQKKSSSGRLIHLVFLIAFTCSSLIGCILLSIGQDEFHEEVLGTLNFVVNQSDCTVQILQNVTDFLTLAKSVNVDQIILPKDVPGKIDRLIADLNHTASTLSEKTIQNSGKIRRVFGDMRWVLIAVAIMLVIASVGFVFSIFKQRQAIPIFIFSGWLLVAITLVLLGVFVILSNVTSDTCAAMNEWVENPQAVSALSSILACVDERTTNSTLQQSKKVIIQLVDVVNTAIQTIVNVDMSHLNPSSFYNQSGPLMPSLCSPFDSQLNDQPCPPSRVSLVNASLVWQSYTCEVSMGGNCTSIGRVTPDLYDQLAAAVNASYALDQYTPFLLSLQDCNFVRETFDAISSFHCPRLVQRLRTVEVGLALVSVGVMLCLLLWVLCADDAQKK